MTQATPTGVLRAETTMIDAEPLQPGMSDAPNYDVVVVGASLAGCTAARLFAQRGISVALVEQHSDPMRHKRMCTHYIQASAVPTIERLGLAPLIERAGGVRSRMEIWTRWGWIKHTQQSQPETYGYSIRRQTLDPIVRRLATATPGVNLMMGWTASNLLKTGSDPTGVSLRDHNGATRKLYARLIVAADGRDSSLANLARVPTTTTLNNRFIYYAYYRNLSLSSGNDSRFWMLDPDAAYVLPNEDGITLVACWPTKDKLEAFRGDREKSFDQFVGELPDGPDLTGVERISEILGAVDLPVELRGGTSGGLALVGDAALAPDPLWGVGCGWAFQSAEWLVECTATALQTRGDLASALARYHKQHRWALVGHYAVIANYARARHFLMLEKLLYSAAAQDSEMAEIILAFGARRIGLGRLLAPTTLARAVWTRLARSASTAS